MRNQPGRRTTWRSAAAAAVIARAYPGHLRDVPAGDRLFGYRRARHPNPFGAPVLQAQPRHPLGAGLIWSTPGRIRRNRSACPRPQGSEPDRRRAARRARRVLVQLYNGDGSWTLMASMDEGRILSPGLRQRHREWPGRSASGDRPHGSSGSAGTQLGRDSAPGRHRRLRDRTDPPRYAAPGLLDPCQSGDAAVDWFPPPPSSRRPAAVLLVLGRRRQLLQRSG